MKEVRVYKLSTHRMVCNLEVVVDKLNDYAVIVRIDDRLCVITCNNDILSKSKIENICLAFMGRDYSLETVGVIAK